MVPDKVPPPPCETSPDSGSEKFRPNHSETRGMRRWPEVPFWEALPDLEWEAPQGPRPAAPRRAPPRYPAPPHWCSLRGNMLYDLKIVKISALVILAVLTAAAQTGPVALKSPDGALEISIATVRGQAVQAAGGQLAYRVTFRGTPVIEWSNLGLLLEGAPALGPAVRIESSQASSQDETWSTPQGKANPVRNHYNAVAVQTVETAAGGRRLTVEARAYDDGVAFRYVVPSSLR